MSEIVNTIKIDTGEAQKSTKSLKTEIKELKDQLNQCTQGSKEYAEILQQLGEKQRTLTENTERVKEASTDFSNNVQYSAQALAGMSGAVQTVTGTLSLMGVETDKDSGLLKTMVAAMSITSGITAMQNGYTAVRKLATGIKMATTAAGGLGKALKAMMMSNPFTAILTAVLAIVTAVVALTNALDKSEDKARAFADELERGLQTLNSMKNNSDFEINLDLARGNISDAESDMKRFQAATERLVESQRLLDDARDKYAKRTKKNADILKEALDKAVAAEQKAYEEQNAIRQQNTINEAKRTADAKKQAAEKAKQAAQAAKDAKASQYEIQKAELSVRKYTDAQYTEIQYTTDLLALEKQKQAALKAGTKDYVSQTVTVVQLENQLSKLLQTQREELETSVKATKEQAMKDASLQAQTKYIEEQTKIIKANKENSNLELIKLDIKYNEEQQKLLDEQYTNNLITWQEYDNQSAQLELERTNLEKEQADERVKIAKEEAEAKKLINQNYYKGLKEITGSLSGILGSIGDTVEQGTKEYKALKISQAIIDTISGGVSAYMGTMESLGGGPWGIAAGVAASAAVLAQGYASVRQIASTQVSKSSSGSSYTPNNITVQSLASTPTNVRQTTTANDYEELNSNQQKMKVYVLANEITDTQNTIKTTVSQNTF